MFVITVKLHGNVVMLKQVAAVVIVMYEKVIPSFFSIIYYRFGPILKDV